MSIKDILKYKVGTCPDQVNLVKNFLDTKKIENQIYVLTGYEIINGIAKERVHFIITYKENNEWYQFEQASRFFRGIFKYGKKENIKQNILDKYKNILKDSNLFEIKEIPTGISYEKLREYIIKEMN